jgi:hypothetical protein
MMKAGWQTRMQADHSVRLSAGTGLALAANDRIQVHLPGFGGAYNSFATTGSPSGLVIGFYLHPLSLVFPCLLFPRLSCFLRLR